MLSRAAIFKLGKFGVFVTLISILSAPAYSQGQGFPREPIRMIVSAAPGGANDILGRMVAKSLTKSLGEPVIVDDMGGAGGSVAAGFVARAAPDGYTLLNTTNSVVVNPSLNPHVGYTLSQLAPVTEFANFPLVIAVNPSVPAHSLQELVALSKKNNGLSFGSTGIGSINHLSGVLLNNVAGTHNIHIPYTGAGPLVNALVAGQVQMGVLNVFSAAPFVRDGRMRAIAVTSSTPSPSLPNVPTIASVYPGYDTNIWHGYFVPANTPAPIVAILQRAIAKALSEPEIKQALATGGGEPVGSTPQAFSLVVAQDTKKYQKLVQSSGAKAE